ncbi:MAG TPA: rhodanese-like domain-containing protein [Candidatus Krumholzibacteria bacterium]|nr:rhodanese-like domain-containing protein [Candidatus Krumholzibacteria bacterium]
MHHSPRFLKIVDDTRPRVCETDIHRIRDRIARGDSFYLVDVREDREWEHGHLPGAIHLGKGVIERDVELTIPDFDADIVLYCGGGFRSVLAAESLARMGYRNVCSMDGGYRGWTEAGFPVDVDR